MDGRAWLEARSRAKPAAEVENPRATAVIAALALLPPDIAELVEVRGSEQGFTALVVEVGVERPQLRAFDIRRRESVAILFGSTDRAPAVLALRADFPDTPHQNWAPEGAPPSLCVDDRPWAEARLTFTGYDLIQRIRSWLARAARGELIDRSQPADPFFFLGGATLISPEDIASDASGAVLELDAERLTPDEAEHQVYAVGAVKAGSTRPKLSLIAVRAAPHPMARLRMVPETLAALHTALLPFDIDLLALVREQVSTRAGVGTVEKARLAGLLAVLVEFQVTDAAGSLIGVDRRAFVAGKTLGEVGVAVGVLLGGQSDEGLGGAYLRAVAPDAGKVGADVGIEVMEVHAPFTPTAAARLSGRAEPDRRRAVLVGAGAIGSQVAATLAREGVFRWNVIDDDTLLPHNLARHALLPWQVGQPKAQGLAVLLQHIAGGEGDAATPIVANVMRETASDSDKVGEALAGADLVIDASASVAVARVLADHPTTARRMSVFFNPNGTAGVLLAEDKARSVTLRDLEAQYYRLVLSEPALAGHLRASEGLSYSGSCRALTTRIPQHRAGLFASLLAGEILQSADRDDASIDVWATSPTRSIQRCTAPVMPVQRLAFKGEWTVVIDHATVMKMYRAREMALPHETGGVLIGVVDTADRSIRVVDALDPTPDSSGSLRHFERGVEGLPALMDWIASETAHQVRYVGEWHTHPRGMSSLPSGVDLGQLFALRAHLAIEGLPPTMIIAGEGGPAILTV